MSIRSGIGFDVHPLVAGRPLVLGGVSIPFDRGLAGHSDGDVLVHAVIDAILGGAGLGDIGAHFPSSDPALRGVDSMLLLRHSRELLARSGWRPTYVDATILAERPVLRPFMAEMQERLAHSLGLDPSAVNLKAKTTDGLGLVGRGEGMGSLAVATVAPIA